MASMITSFSSVSMILLYFPIISMMRFLFTRSPSSSLCSATIRIILSREGCSMASILPPISLLRSSMVNAGAVAGEGLFFSVRQTKGMDEPTDISSRFTPYSCVLTAIISSSLSGSAIFDMYPSVRKCRSSQATAHTVTPSNAIL